MRRFEDGINKIKQPQLKIGMIGEGELVCSETLLGAIELETLETRDKNRIGIFSSDDSQGYSKKPRQGVPRPEGISLFTVVVSSNHFEYLVVEKSVRSDFLRSQMLGNLTKRLFKNMEHKIGLIETRLNIESQKRGSDYFKRNMHETTNLESLRSKIYIENDQLKQSILDKKSLIGQISEEEVIKIVKKSSKMRNRHVLAVNDKARWKYLLETPFRDLSRPQIIETRHEKKLVYTVPRPVEHNISHDEDTKNLSKHYANYHYHHHRPQETSSTRGITINSNIGRTCNLNKRSILSSAKRRTIEEKSYDEKTEGNILTVSADEVYTTPYPRSFLNERKRPMTVNLVKASVDIEQSLQNSSLKHDEGFLNIQVSKTKNYTPYKRSIIRTSALQSSSKDQLNNPFNDTNKISMKKPFSTSLAINEESKIKLDKKLKNFLVKLKARGCLPSQIDLDDTTTEGGAEVEKENTEKVNYHMRGDLEGEEGKYQRSISEHNDKKRGWEEGIFCRKKNKRVNTASSLDNVRMMEGKCRDIACGTRAERPLSHGFQKSFKKIFNGKFRKMNLGISNDEYLAATNQASSQTAAFFPTNMKRRIEEMKPNRKKRVVPFNSTEVRSFSFICRSIKENGQNPKSTKSKIKDKAHYSLPLSQINNQNHMSA